MDIEPLDRIDGLKYFLADEGTRKLFESFCGEVIDFSNKVSVETTHFEIRFSGEGGFKVKVSPYRQLFVVSLGSSPTIDVRVFDESGFIRALDLTLSHFLESLSTETDTLFIPSR